MRIDQPNNSVSSNDTPSESERTAGNAANFEAAVRNADRPKLNVLTTPLNPTATGRGVSNETVIANTNTFHVLSNDAPPDYSLIDGSKYSDAKAWDKIVGNNDNTPTKEELDLDRPLTVAKMLEDNWDKWGLHDRSIDFANPPTDMPPEAQAALKYLANSPSLMAALSSGGGQSHTDTTITRADVGTFVAHAEADLSGANDAYQKFLTKNPNATSLAKENAKSVAILMANATLVSSAGKDIKYDNTPTKSGGVLNPEDLSKLNNSDAAFTTLNLDGIKNDAGLSKPLTDAAAYWSSAGMGNLLDTGGDNPLTSKPDGVAMEHNLAGWLENQAPADDDGVLMLINNAAIRNSVGDVDTTKLTKDVIDHPENYDAKTKAAVLLQLLDTRTKLTLSAGPDGSDYYSGAKSYDKGLNPDKAKVLAQLDNAINTLGGDADVNKFLADAQGPAMKAIVDSNPELKAALQNFQDTKINGGQIFNDLENTKDANGNPISLPDILRLVANDANLSNLALGGNNKVDLAAVAEKAGKSDEIQKYFQEHILSGKDLDDALAADKAKGDKSDPAAVIKKFASDAAAFEDFLGDKLTTSDKTDLEVTINDAMADSILEGAGPNDLKSFFADQNGNFDESKVREIIDKAKQADPNLLTDSSGKPISTEDIISMTRSMWDSIRQGEKIKDVLPKVIDNLKLNVDPAYKQGLLHIGSSLLAGGILASKIPGGGTSPTDDASKAATAMQFFGTMVEGGSKYAKEAGYGYSTKSGTRPDGGSYTEWTGDGPFTDAQLTKLANTAKLFGGGGSALGGILDLYSGVKSALNGDRLNAGFSLTSGTLSVFGGLASIVEGAAGLFGASATATWAGVAAGIFGWGGALFGAVTGIVFPTIAVAKRDQQQDAFYDSILPTLTQYGLNGGPYNSSDIPDAPPVPSGNG